jgi:hypothetical protein
VITLRWLARSLAWVARPMVQAGLFSVLFIAQVFPLPANAPYYFTYLNPLVSLVAGKPATFFYGECMEKAAAYLAEKPDAENQTALVYFGRSFSYYYPGKTLLFKPVLFEDKPQLVDELKLSDYLVVYSGLEERLPLLKELTPEYVIELYATPHVEIYRVADIPSEFFDE